MVIRVRQYNSWVICVMPHGIAGVSVPRETGEVKGVVPRPWPQQDLSVPKWGTSNLTPYFQTVSFPSENLTK